MTITQFLKKQYLGKYASFIIRQVKDMDGKISFDRIMYSLYYDQWEYRLWTKEQQGYDREFYIRDLEIADLVLEVRKSHGKWLLITLNGYKLELGTENEYEVVKKPNQKQLKIKMTT